MLKFGLVLSLFVVHGWSKPWFAQDSQKSDFEETVDTWITKTDRNERNIKILQDQIEEIGEVLEYQSEMIGHLQDLVSFGIRQYDDNQLENSLDIENLEPMLMQEEKESDETVENGEQVSDEINDEENKEEENSETDEIEKEESNENEDDSETEEESELETP